jgi:hypothetical protein
MSDAFMLADQLCKAGMTIGVALMIVGVLGFFASRMPAE